MTPFRQHLFCLGCVRAFCSHPTTARDPAVCVDAIVVVRPGGRPGCTRSEAPMSAPKRAWEVARGKLTSADQTPFPVPPASRPSLRRGGKAARGATRSLPACVCARSCRPCWLPQHASRSLHSFACVFRNCAARVMEHHQPRETERLLALWTATLELRCMEGPIRSQPTPKEACVRSSREARSRIPASIQASRGGPSVQLRITSPKPDAEHKVIARTQ